jgi:hypothetical protein
MLLHGCSDAPVRAGSVRHPQRASDSGVLTKWQVPACASIFDSSSSRINEQNSGLLIRGFGVQVPGGAPDLTWGFITPGHFLCARFVPVLRACSLPACSGVGCWRPVGRADWSRPITGVPSDVVTQRDSGRQEPCGRAVIRYRFRRGCGSWLASGLNPHSRAPSLRNKVHGHIDASGASWPAPLAAATGDASRGPLKVVIRCHEDSRRDRQWRSRRAHSASPGSWLRGGWDRFMHHPRRQTGKRLAYLTKMSYATSVRHRP